MDRLIGLVLVGLVLAGGLWAGESSSAGGGGIICRDAAGKILNAQLLDFYEGENLWGLTPDFGVPNLSVEAKLELAFKRLEKLDKAKADDYRKKLVFFNENYTTTKAPLGLIPDLGQVVLALEPGCKVEQFALRQRPTLPYDTIFLISGKIWDAMDNDQRAGLLLHEVIYMHASDQGYQNSKVARFMTALFSSDKMGTLSQTEYDKIMLDYGMADHSAIIFKEGQGYVLFDPTNSPQNPHKNGNMVCENFSADWPNNNLLNLYQDSNLIPRQSSFVRAGKGRHYYFGYWSIALPSFSFVTPNGTDDFVACYKNLPTRFAKKVLSTF